MKHSTRFYLICFFLILQSCNKDQIEMSCEEKIETIIYKNEATVSNFHVGINHVKYYLKIVNKGNPDKVVQDITPCVRNGDTLAYIVNYSKNKGWEIISADKRTDCVLLYDKEGRYSYNLRNLNEEFWRESLLDKLYEIKHSNIIDTTSFSYKLWNNIEFLMFGKSNVGKTKGQEGSTDGYWDLESLEIEKMSTNYIGPFIDTFWGQGDPWNACVPCIPYYTVGTRCVAGCVAVSGAQMLYYLHYKLGIPETMFSEGSCVGYSDGKQCYDYNFSFGARNAQAWDTMAKYEGEIGKSAYATSILIGYVGHKTGMLYSPNASGASHQNLVDFFHDEGISCYIQDVNFYSVLSSLSEEIPVIFEGYSGNSGHSWIISGIEQLREKVIVTYAWRVYDPENPDLVDLYPPTKIKEEINSKYHYIMNWGWGSGNTYCSVHSNELGGFTDNMKMIIGFSAM